MSCFDKQHYKELKATAHEDGLNYVIGEYYTAVFSTPRANLRMVFVSVSYCSPEDNFKKKHGKYQALLKFYSGEYVQLPFGDWDVVSIHAELANMFNL